MTRRRHSRRSGNTLSAWCRRMWHRLHKGLYPVQRRRGPPPSRRGGSWCASSLPGLWHVRAPVAVSLGTPATPHSRAHRRPDSFAACCRLMPHLDTAHHGGGDEPQRDRAIASGSQHQRRRNVVSGLSLFAVRFVSLTLPASSPLTIATDRDAASSPWDDSGHDSGPSFASRRRERTSKLDSLHLRDAGHHRAPLDDILQFSETEPVADDRLELAPRFTSCSYELGGRLHPQTLGNAKDAQVPRACVGAGRYTVALLLCDDSRNTRGHAQGLDAPGPPQGDSGAPCPATAQVDANDRPPLTRRDRTRNGGVPIVAGQQHRGFVAARHVQTVGQEPGLEPRVSPGRVPFLQQLAPEVTGDGHQRVARAGSLPRSHLSSRHHPEAPGRRLNRASRPRSGPCHQPDTAGARVPM